MEGAWSELRWCAIVLSSHEHQDRNGNCTTWTNGWMKKRKLCFTFFFSSSNLLDSFANAGLSNFFSGVSILGLSLSVQASMSLPFHLWFFPFSFPQTWSPVQCLRIPAAIRLSCIVSSILPFQSCCSFSWICDSRCCAFYPLTLSHRSISPEVFCQMAPVTKIHFSYSRAPSLRWQGKIS